MRTINQRELRNDSSAVLRDVENGQTIIVTRNGTSVAELRPLRGRRAAPVEDWIARTRHLPRLDRDRLRADVDAAVDQTIG